VRSRVQRRFVAAGLQSRGSRQACLSIVAKVVGGVLVFGAFSGAVAAGVFAQDPDRVRVTVPRANVRAEPSEQAPILTQVTAGSVFDVRGIEGDWFRIQLIVSGVRLEAWISKKVSALVASAPSLPAVAARSAAARATVRPPASARFEDAARYGLGVGLQTPAGLRWFAPATARVVRLATRVENARAAAIAMPVGAGRPLPESASAQITYVWQVEERAPALVVDAPSPTFVVRYREAPGVSPEDFAPVLVQLTGTAAGPRVVAAMRGRVDQASRAQTDWDLGRDLKHEVLKTVATVRERGIVEISPAANLAPGRYAIVLRPTGNKRFAGTSVLDDNEEGRVFGMAWVIEVR
jgi:hypothetical protein